MILRRATLTLTAAFTVVQLLLFAVFAVGIYLFVTATFDYDAAEANGDGAVTGAEQGFAALRNGLIVSYAVLVVVVPIVSYVMARLALRPVRRSFELQQQFVDGASHELRSPLSVIQGELELIVSRRRSPDEYEAAISISLDAIDNLTHLTNDLLLLTESNWTVLDTVAQYVQVEDLVATAIRDIRGGDTRVVLHPGSTRPVLASPVLLTRAIANIIDNAVKYTPDSGTVTVVTREADGAIVIEVIDTGVGMDTKEMTHVFERFWRSDSARSTQGHGLGLSLVKQIMRAHRGTVVITSVPGSGTRATLSLPVSSS